MRDPAYKEFHAKLIPTVNADTIIGVRMPTLRALAKELDGTPEACAFLAALPHAYYEENNLHGCLIDRMRDYGQAMTALEAFLPYVDNWATCDLMSPKAFKKNLPGLYEKICGFLATKQTYTVRFGIGMLMRFFLDESFQPGYLDLAAGVDSDEYYVRMMVAWYFATALAKQYDAAIGYIQQKRLPVWTHNKTIQKAVESDRITDAQKRYLKTLKVKEARG